MTIAPPQIGSLLVTLALLLPMGCEEERGTAVDGESCQLDADCASMLCVAGIAGPDGVCTRSCAANDECPEGWSCGAVTQRGVVVCRQGASTPFGQ